MKLSKNTLKCFMKRDGSVGQSACIKAWRHKFDPQNTHKVEGENGLPALSPDLPSTSEERGQRNLMTSFTRSPFWKSVTLCDYSHPFCSPVFPESRLNSAHQSMAFLALIIPPCLTDDFPSFPPHPQTFTYIAPGPAIAIEGWEKHQHCI